MKGRIYFLALLVLAMGTFLMAHFAMILVYGRFYIYESNSIVLLSEITFISAIITFAVYCIIDQLRKIER